MPGYPIFEFDRALGMRRYLLDNEYVSYAGMLYLDKSVKKKQILQELQEKLKYYPGRFESDEEVEKRYRYELIDSKKILEERLSKEVGFLCWPGGGYNDLSLKIAIEAGYKASTIASREQSVIIDNSGKYKRIRRFGLNSVYQVNGNMYFRKEKNWAIKTFLFKTNHLFYKNYFRVLHYGYRMMDLLTRRRTRQIVDSE
jgi:hypothetical protein